jgi:hypothetical protein
MPADDSYDLHDYAAFNTKGKGGKDSERMRKARAEMQLEQINRNIMNNLSCQHRKLEDVRTLLLIEGSYIQAAQQKLAKQTSIYHNMLMDLEKLERDKLSGGTRAFLDCCFRYHNHHSRY